jgi:hypothetical protein
MTALAPLLTMTLATAADSQVSHPFGPGEELVFQIKTLGMKSGTAQFNVGAAETVRDLLAWPIVMFARSEGLTDTVFPIRDRFATFWELKTGLPVEAVLAASEGGRKRSMTIRFHRGEGPHAEVHVSEPGKDPVSLSDPMDPNAQDFQSAVYWLRTRPLKVGDREEIPIVAGKRQWVMVATVTATPPLDVPAGHFDAVRVDVTTAFAGKLQSRGSTVGFFSSDARHLPLRFEADLALGKMVAELIRFVPGLAAE